MKILVVEDNPKHGAAAAEQLGEHDLTVVDSYGEAIKLLAEGHGFDAVLSDLMMPAEAMTLGPEGLKYLGHQMPIGFVVALRAAAMGVKWIAVITDANHHNHPMSAALDFIRPAFTINQSRALYAHAVLREDGAKDWKAALQAVTGG